ncbi:MAG: WG repeat-containing protein [Clostridia bacterium]|nr:WG repeat-containing protein [Clostridia bacterium]
MRLSKYISFVMCIIMLTSFIGCAETLENEPKEATMFGLKENVVAPEPQVQGVIQQRFNKEYTDTLKASSKYGELIPFIGGYVTYSGIVKEKEKTVSVPLYGLCTLKGEVVVDAVYDVVKQHPKDEGGFVYELVKGSDGSDPLKGTRQIAASDGSWIINVPKNSVFYRAGGERIIFERTKKVKKVVYTYHDFYDYKGKKKFTFDTALAENMDATYTIGKFSEGLAPVNITVKEKKDDEVTETKTAYYIDKDGKKIIEKLTSCEEFRKGYAVAVNEEGLYGVITPKGEWFLEAKYRIVNYNSTKELFACADVGFFLILDKEKKQVKKIFTERGDVEVLNSDRLVYKKTNPDTGRTEYFYADNDEPFTCIETGQFPDGDSTVEGLYTCVYSGTGTVFNIDGENIVSIGDYGELCDRFGNTAIVSNANGKKICFISVSTKKRTEWIRYRYLGQSVDDRYIVMQNSDNGLYSLYDLMTNTFVYENCEYIEVFKVGDSTMMSVVVNSVASVYNGKLEILMSSAATALH